MGDRKNAEPEDRKKSCETLSSRQNMAAAVTESQASHMSALALHKDGPIPSEPLRQKGLKGTYPALLNSLLLVDLSVDSSRPR